MKTFEVDVELRVRKTLRFNATDEHTARNMALGVTTLLSPELGAMAAFLKWTDDRTAHRPMPVETIIDNDPQIVAVREVP